MDFYKGKKDKLRVLMGFRISKWLSGPTGSSIKWPLSLVGAQVMNLLMLVSLGRECLRQLYVGRFLRLQVLTRSWQGLWQLRATRGAY